MKKDLFLEYYVIKNIANKLNKNISICESDYIILKELNGIYDINNVVAKMIINNEVGNYKDYLLLINKLEIIIYNDYGILL